MKKLLLGTSNPRKMDFYRRFFSKVPYGLVTSKEVGIPEPEETSETIEGNARLKARYYFEKSGLPTLADDGGFEIPALNNFPGTHSRRFAGANMTDEDVIVEILERMKGLANDQRKASMKVVVALALSPDEIHSAAGQIEGIVPEAPYDKRMAHFPYRSLLYLPSRNKWFYDLSDEEEEQLGYRGAAVKQLIKYLV